jgi:hypothetical protein
MELNALASWQSIGRDLYALGTLEQELQRARRAHQRRLRAIKDQKLGTLTIMKWRTDGDGHEHNNLNVE